MRSDTPRRSASPPTSCSMVSDRISRAKASSTGRKSRFETGSMTDGGSKRVGGIGPKIRSSGLMPGTTAGVDASKGLSSIMLTSQELSGYAIRGEVRTSRQLSPIHGCGHGSADVALATLARLVPVICAPSPRFRGGHGHGSMRDAGQVTHNRAHESNNVQQNGISLYLCIMLRSCYLVQQLPTRCIHSHARCGQPCPAALQRPSTDRSGGR